MWASHVVSSSASFASLSPALRRVSTVVSGAVYIIALIAVNLVGYGVGVAGMSTLLTSSSSLSATSPSNSTIISYHSLGVLMACFYILCWGVRFMEFLKENRFTADSAIEICREPTKLTVAAKKIETVNHQ